MFKFILDIYSEIYKHYAITSLLNQEKRRIPMGVGKRVGFLEAKRGYLQKSSI